MFVLSGSASSGAARAGGEAAGRGWRAQGAWPDWAHAERLPERLCADGAEGAQAPPAPAGSAQALGSPPPAGKAAAASAPPGTGHTGRAALRTGGCL